MDEPSFFPLPFILKPFFIYLFLSIKFKSKQQNTMDENTAGGNLYESKSSRSYALSGKIMLIAIIILFTVVITMVCLHLYARWYLLRARRRHNLRRNRTRLVFYVDSHTGGAAAVRSGRGLDADVLKSLPFYAFKSSEKESDMVVECAVCLSEFREDEMMRCLPKCKHCFHIECIDMWFHSHSTCPLCRSPVEVDRGVDVNDRTIGNDSVLNGDEVVVTVNDSVQLTETDSTSGFCSSCRHDNDGETNRIRSSSSSSSLFGNGKRRKPVVSIEVPRRLHDESGTSESPSSQSYKSPITRMQSLKMMISRGLSPSGAGPSCSGGELDIEKGRDELTPRNRVDTPR